MEYIAIGEKNVSKYTVLSEAAVNPIFYLQAVLDGYGWLLKDQSSRLPHVNKFLKKVPDYQVI